MPISFSFRDLTQDRQTTDAVTETEGSHTKCASLMRLQCRADLHVWLCWSCQYRV